MRHVHGVRGVVGTRGGGVVGTRDGGGRGGYRGGRGTMGVGVLRGRPAWLLLLPGTLIPRLAGQNTTPGRDVPTEVSTEVSREVPTEVSTEVSRGLQRSPDPARSGTQPHGISSQDPVASSGQMPRREPVLAINSFSTLVGIQPCQGRCQ